MKLVQQVEGTLKTMLVKYKFYIFIYFSVSNRTLKTMLVKYKF